MRPRAFLRHLLFALSRFMLYLQLVSVASADINPYKLSNTAEVIPSTVSPKTAIKSGCNNDCHLAQRY
jgi:hypothetical protein